MKKDWRHRAICRSVDPELFFPIGTTGPSLLQAEQAKAICSFCPVRDECLTWAIQTDQRLGIWGGTDEQERATIIRRGGLRALARS